ncbi:MAG: PLD nuclease N-terminal domain-containing protein [Thermodesulfovibrionales bacterium]
MFGLGLQELIILFVLFVPIGLMLIAFVDILRNEFTGSNKIVWLIAVILVPFIGPIAYFFIGRKQKVGERKKIKKRGRRNYSFGKEGIFFK